MNKKQRYEKVIEYFEKEMPDVGTELHYTTAYELIVAVTLSAQCTDKRVNIVTPPFFKAFPDFKTLAGTSQDVIFEFIKSVTYPNNKSKQLLGMAQMVQKDFEGILPNTFENITKLPGVGRKTANVLLSVLYNQPRMAVDTHVFRVSQRIGLAATTKDFLKVENELLKNFPASKIAIGHHWLILHGRYTCKAQKPSCEHCGIKSYCKFFEKILPKCK